MQTVKSRPPPSDIATIPGCVTVLAEAFGKVTSVGTFRAYELGLRGLSSDQIKAATQKALETCRFMPAPAELLEMVFIRTEDRAAKAWLVFEAAVVQHGYIRTVQFDDPVINATIRALGGWEHCCGMPTTEFDTFLQKRFQETYCSLSRAGVSAEQGAPLMGWIDRENGINGYDQERPELIETGMPTKPATRIERQAKPERPVDLPRLELKTP